MSDKTGPEPRLAEAELQSTVLASQLMAHLAGNISAKIDTFATWLLAGFGAALALLLSSHDVNSLVSPATTRFSAKMFLIAVVVTVIEKYLSVIVTGASDAAERARIAFKEHLDDRAEKGLSTDLSMHKFASEFLRPMFKPGVWLAGLQIRKALAGDLTAGARPIMYMAQLQALLLLIEVGLLVAALAKLVSTIPT